tara:strand:+ start:1607 stop:1861 length:255 start_codon:yes stop_codon:yes gene_type:complete
MKSYIYKVLIAVFAVILTYKLTIGKELNQINDKINYFSSSEGRKELIGSLKKEIRKANNKENYLDEEEKELLKTFINKIKKELE